MLSEYGGGEAAVRRRAALETLGYRHATPVAPPPGRSLLIAARCAFHDPDEVDGGLPKPTESSELRGETLTRLAALGALSRTAGG